MSPNGGNHEIAVDGRSLQGQPRGVGIYTYSLLAAMSRSSAAGRITVFLDASLPKPEHIPDLAVRLVAGFGGTVAWDQFHLPRALKGFRLLHSPANSAPYFSPCPVVLTLHDAIFVRRLRDISQVTYIRQILGHIYRKYGYPRCARRAAAVIAVSEAVRGEIIERVGVSSERVTVVPEALSESFSRTIPLPEAHVRGRLGIEGPYLLAMGAYEKRKNVPLLFDVLAILKRRGNSGLKLLLAGADNLEATRYRERVRELDLEDAVAFMSYVDEQTLKSLYQYAAAFLRPSWSEGFALPALEAMSCGTPLIASDIPVHREVIGDAGILIRPDDPEKWADGIQRIMQDPAETERYRDRARIRIGDFSWDRAAQSVLEVYDRVLKS